jgi:hypothetical protein
VIHYNVHVHFMGISQRKSENNEFLFNIKKTNAHSCMTIFLFISQKKKKIVAHLLKKTSL